MVIEELVTLYDSIYDMVFGKVSFGKFLQGKLYGKPFFPAIGDSIPISFISS